jgi:acyl carrier protein
MFDELVEIICNYVDVQPADVHEESRFMEDLGFTSFDFMSMLGEIEDTFHELLVLNIDIIDALENLTSTPYVVYMPQFDMDKIIDVMKH